MPKKWNVSTGQVDKWPYILQVSWTVYRKSGEKVLQQNYYINPGEININENSLKIHGITLDFLQKNGISRYNVLHKLADDLLRYEPLIVGHFIQFDLKMLEVGFNRAGITHNLAELPKFCTMLNTRCTYPIDHKPMLRLGDLYYQIFNQKLKNQHNALVDAEATKDCFFELVKRGSLDKSTVERQQKHFKTRRSFRSLFLNLLT